MNSEPTIPSCESSFPAVTASIAAARHWVRDCVEGFGDPLRGRPISQTTELLVSELITNAIRHGAGPPLIRLTWNGRLLRIAVSDDSDRWPRMRATERSEPGGFGMQLLEQLAQRWGVTPRHPGKTVWADLSSAPEEGGGELTVPPSVSQPGATGGRPRLGRMSCHPRASTGSCRPFQTEVTHRLGNGYVQRADLVMRASAAGGPVMLLEIDRRTEDADKLRR
ncbi:ATP-binding protein [Streptomyces rishiriensis]|uniref:Anti-sigma regulatory factor (Ser/Thr protein kinase) n=1 Tax=Streptomyces rishiriensis TaxID=68264 RepID=A0ABU0NFV2_STRRH|nr:ATP-binding protein [Streptomyces rishiriensis]MDQ0577986.1 anti-sigma regulatory factor (Ser/Thr protein kinase) [Streptomyces rishiriensis]